MKAHDLAKLLLAGPNLPVLINGWGSDEGLGPYEVTKIVPGNEGIFTTPEPVLNLNYDDNAKPFGRA